MRIFNDPRYPKGSSENPKSALWLRFWLALFGLAFAVFLIVVQWNRGFFWVGYFLALIAIINIVVVLTRIYGEKHDR